MKVFINREFVNGPYGGGNQFVKAFLEIAPQLGVYVGTRLNQKYDAVLLMDPRPDDTTGIGIEEVKRFKLFQPKVKIIQRVNECDARKQTTGVDQMLAAAGVSNDCTIFVSDWMRDYHQRRQWPCQKTAVIYNGVDKKIFKPNQKLNNGKVNIVTAHWSDNPYKGQDVHQWLDGFVGQHPNEFTYTFIGRHQNNFSHTKHVEPLFGSALGEELGKYDICVTGTRADPGPNHCIEAISCGIPTYAHVQGGGAVEFVDANHTYDTVEQLEAILRKTSHEPNAVKFPSWEECVLQYIKKIEEVVNGNS